MVANNQTKALFDAAMKLAPTERAALLDGLLAELSQESEQDVAQAWADVAESRIDEIDSEKVQLIDGDSILNALSDGRRP